MSVLNGSKPLIFVIALASLFLAITVGASEVDNSTPICADVALVFNRGSGENHNSDFLNKPFEENFKGKEQVLGSFFKTFQKTMDSEYPNVTYKAVSVHNFPNLYNSNGYKAVGVFSARTFLNAVQAEFSWFPFGEYNKSVGDGKAETVGYIKDQISLCPEQQLVLGGYSQGAQVMGESVFQLSSTERQHISAVALFGDPKYVGSDIGSTASSLNWFDGAVSFLSRPKAKPWKRGSAGLNDRGLADARIPYLPSDLEYKTTSWCFNDDFVCAGGSGIFQTIISSIQNGSTPATTDYTNGHNRYVTFGAPQAAREVVQRLSQSLRAIDLSRGGLDTDGLSTQSPPITPNNKPVDIMMMLNTSSGVDDVLGNMRLNTEAILKPHPNFYSNIFYGIGEYSENGTLPNSRIPRVTINQDLTNNIDTLVSKMYRSLAFGGLSGGGLDPPDPHQIAIERAVMSTSWRKDSEKHIVLITKRMPSNNYTYNICNSSVRIGFGIPGSNYCNVNPVLETSPASQNPERCANAYDALTKDNCTVGLTSPHHTFNVVRNPDEAITFALARGIMIDVVVPSTIYEFYDSATGKTYTIPMITAALKKIADSTGGVFLQYSSFTMANYTDMYWRILNHQSHVLPLSAIVDFDAAGSADNLDPFKPKEIKTKQPVLFDATSDKISQEYKWDFNGDGVWDESTDSPSTDYVYPSVIGSVFAVAAGFNDGVVQSRSILPINVTLGEDSLVSVVPKLPEGLEARWSGEDVVVSWTTEDAESLLFIADPTSGLPLVSAPLSAGSIVLQNFDSQETTLVVWVDDEFSSSNREELTIIEESVKVLVVSESSPNSQFIGQQSSPESGAQNNSSSNGTSSQITLQDEGGLTEVKSETQAQTLQQTGGVSKEDLAEDIDQPETGNSNTLLYIILGLVFVGIISGAVYYAYKTKD